MRSVIVPVVLIMLVGGFTVGVVAFSGERHDKKWFDERQLIIQGRGFMVGFAVMLVYALAVVLAEAILGRELLDTSVALVICADLGLVAFAEYCILRDAYVSIRKSAVGEIAAMGILTACFAVNAAVRIDDGLRLSETASLRSGAVFAMQAAVCGIIAVTLLIKMIWDRRHGE